MNKHHVSAQAFLDQSNAELLAQCRANPDNFEMALELIQESLQSDESYKEFIEYFFTNDMNLGRNMLCLLGAKLGEIYLQEARGEQSED